jgi:hypothetical protein
MMAEVAERKFKGDSLHVTVLREGKKEDLTITFERAFPYTIQANAYDVQPTYVLFAGMLFQPLSRNLMGTYRFENQRIEYLFDHFFSKEVYRDHPEVIVLSSILPDPINTYLSEFREAILDEINGKKIHTLREAAEALSQPAETFVIKFLGVGRPLVLERAAVEKARERIRTRYNVLAEQNLEESPAS